MFFRPRTTRIPFKANERKRKVGQRLQRIEPDLTSDRHARAAIEAYADSCAVDMPWLAELLRQSEAHGTGDLSACAATVRRVFALAQPIVNTQEQWVLRVRAGTNLNTLGANLARRSDTAGSGDGAKVVWLSAMAKRAVCRNRSSNRTANWRMADLRRARTRSLSIVD